MAADYKRRHITWGRIVTPFVCLCVWHSVNSAIEMPHVVGLTNHCTNRDELPTQANDHNSHTSNASQTNKTEAVNQSNLQLPGGVAAGTPNEIPHHFLAAYMRNLDRDLEKHRAWMERNSNVGRQNENHYTSLWVIVMLVLVLLDEVQLVVARKLAQIWTRVGLVQTLPSCVQGWPTKWLGRCARGFMILGAVVTVIQSKDLDSRQMSFMNIWNMQMPKKHLKSIQIPNMYQHIKGCDTYLWASSHSINLKQNHTLGDGNCWWRAVAHGQSQKWYTIKRRVLHHAVTKMNLDDNQITCVKAMRKAKVWADEVAVHATAHFLRKTVVVVSGQQIILIKPRDNATRFEQDTPIFISHSNNHFSYIHRQQAQQILAQHVDKAPRSFEDYRTPVDDGRESPLIRRSTARSIPLHGKCGKAQATKATVDLMRSLLFPTRHVPSDNVQSCTTAPGYSSEPDDEWSDADANEGDRRYGHVHRRFAPATHNWTRDCCQFGAVLGYIGVLVLCRLLGGGCPLTCKGSSIPSARLHPSLSSSLHSKSLTTCKELEMSSRQLSGAVAEAKQDDSDTFLDRRCFMDGSIRGGGDRRGLCAYGPLSYWKQGIRRRNCSRSDVDTTCSHNVWRAFTICCKLLAFIGICMRNIECPPYVSISLHESCAGPQALLHQCCLGCSKDLVTSGNCKTVTFATCQGDLRVNCSKLRIAQQLNDFRHDNFTCFPIEQISCRPEPLGFASNFGSQKMSGESLADSFRRVAAADSSPALPRAFGKPKAAPAVRPKMLLGTTAPGIRRSMPERPTEPEGPPPRRLRAREPEGPPPRHILEQRSAEIASSSAGSGVLRTWPPPTPPRRSRTSSASSISGPASPKPSASPTLRPPLTPLQSEDEPEIARERLNTVSPAVVSTAPLRKLYIWSTGHSVKPPIPQKIQEARTHNITLDARWIQNPAFGALGRYHTGKHPGIFNGIYAVPGAITWAVEALVQARQHPLVDIRVLCSAGRHRSVAIAELLKAVATQVFHAEAEILFLHWAKANGAWRHLCAPCAVCAGFQAHEDFQYYVQEAIAEYQRLTAAAYKGPVAPDVCHHSRLTWQFAPPVTCPGKGTMAKVLCHGAQQWFALHDKTTSNASRFCTDKITLHYLLVFGLFQMKCIFAQQIFYANNNHVYNQQILQPNSDSKIAFFALSSLCPADSKECRSPGWMQGIMAGTKCSAKMETSSARLFEAVTASEANFARKPFTQPLPHRQHDQPMPTIQLDNKTFTDYSQVGTPFLLELVGLATSLFGDCRSDPTHGLTNRIPVTLSEPRNVNDPWEHTADQACGGALWDCVGLLSAFKFWGGAIMRLGLLCCSILSCADIQAIANNCPAMHLNMADVSMHAWTSWTGSDAGCSIDLYHSNATTSISISKFCELESVQVFHKLVNWEGTFENNFGMQLFDEIQQANIHASKTFCNTLFHHKFDEHRPNNFECHRPARAHMALAEQIRRVAQADNFALPRAWRGIAGPRSNVVPQILERPAAKARLVRPRPTRSPDLDLMQAIAHEVAEAPPSTESVEIVEFLDNDPGTQEQWIQLVSIGSRWNNNRPVQVTGHLVECDLQEIDDPGRDRSLQAHLGYHPDTMSRLMGNIDFTQPLFDALFEALQHQQSTIRFTCASGRHRSVGAVHLAQAVLRGIVSNSHISIQHASRNHWGNLCNLSCAECYHFVHHPPAPYLRAIAVIREDLLQALRGYMDRSDACRLGLQATCCRCLKTCTPCSACITCAGTVIEPSTSPSTGAMENIKMSQNILATTFTILQQTSQQISSSQSSKCVTNGRCNDFRCPFPDRVQKFLGTRCAAKGWNRFPHNPLMKWDRDIIRSSLIYGTSFVSPCPCPSVDSHTACPLRKFGLDQTRYWERKVQSIFIWPLLHNHKYCQLKGCTFPFFNEIGVTPSPTCSPTLTGRRNRLAQPRTAQYGWTNVVPDGHANGNRGPLSGRTKGLGLHIGIGQAVSFYCDVFSSQQIVPHCMPTVAATVHAWIESDVNEFCQPVDLRLSFTLRHSGLVTLCNTVARKGNSLGSCILLYAMPLRDPAHLQIVFLCKFRPHILILQHFHSKLKARQAFQQHNFVVSIRCLERQSPGNMERLSEALQRVAKAKVSPSLPKAFTAPPAGPLTPKLLVLRGPPKPPPGRADRPTGNSNVEPPSLNLLQLR